MYYSIFQLFKIGIGPSSSHTMGPMNAANLFIDDISSNNHLNDIKELKVELFGSLAHTGVGHKTIDAIIIGLHGVKPHEIINSEIESILNKYKLNKKVILNNKKIIKFDIDNDILINKIDLFKEHSNALKFSCIFKNNNISSKIYFSIGGGFVIENGSKHKQDNVSLST